MQSLNQPDCVLIRPLFLLHGNNFLARDCVKGLAQVRSRAKVTPPASLGGVAPGRRSRWVVCMACPMKSRASRRWLMTLSRASDSPLPGRKANCGRCCKLFEMPGARASRAAPASPVASGRNIITQWPERNLDGVVVSLVWVSSRDQHNLR